MKEEEAVQIESTQRQHHQELLQQVRIDTAVTEVEYTRFAMLKPKIYKDGNQWCVLLGEDVQKGICGFGKTPHEAISDWDNAFNKEE